MILSGASRRGSKRAALGSGVHCRRHFIFLPYFHRHGLEQLVKRRRKGFPEDPLQLLFSASRKDGKDPWKLSSLSRSEKQVWGRKWEYEERNGVSSERTSEYVSGKGWVDVDPGIQNQKSDDCAKKLDEEFEIDLITLRRVPKSTGGIPRTPSASREGLKSSLGSNREPENSGGLTADTNLQQPPPKSSPTGEQYPNVAASPGTPGGFRKEAPKTVQTSQGPVSESSHTQSEPPSGAKESRAPEATDPQKNDTRAAVPKDSVTSTSTSDVSRDTLDKPPQYPKPPPGIMTPPPPLEPVKPSASVAINPPEKLDTYTDVLQVTPSETNPPPASTSVESQRVSLDPAASSDIPVKPVVAKISQELPAKPAEALNTGKSDPHKHQAVYAERSLEDTPEPLPATGIPNVNTSTRPLSSPTSTVENIDDVSRPTRPEIITASDAETGTAVGIWPADVVATLERGTETSPPAETIRGTSVGDTTPSDTAAPVSISPKPAKPVKPATDSDAGVDVEARVINPPTELNETLVPRPSIPTAPLDAILEVTPSGPANPVSGSSTKILAHGASKEFEDVISPPPPPSPVVEEPLKFHSLNVSSSLGGALDSPDADLDLLLPSDIRAAAGAPGKTILKVEDSSEKAQRRAKMIADFEAAEEKRKLSEDIGPESLEGIKERIQKLSAVMQTSVEKLEGELRANGIECDTNSAHKLLALGGSKNTHTGDPSGEKVSTKDVLGTFNPTNTNSIDATPASTSTYKFFVLIRNPESDHIQFSTLPSGLVSDAMIRKNTAFDSLQSLDFPEKFLPLWMVLQKGGFTVVGGEKDCLVVKVEADVAMEKQELVMKEIRLKLSPAEAVAREGWEKKRRVNQPDTVEDGSGKSSGGVERPTTVTIPISHPVVIPGATIPSHDHPESKTAFINETIEKPHPNEETQESKPQVQETKSKKKRPFRRLFWTAVWVAACTGAVNVALEEYI